MVLLGEYKKINGDLLKVTNEDINLLKRKTSKFWEGVLSIGDKAFLGCESLTKIKIPENVRSIMFGGFSDCDSLKVIKISESLTFIGRNAFYNCKLLTKIEIPEGVKNLKVLFLKVVNH